MRIFLWLLLVCSFSSVHADVVWPSMYIVSGRFSIPVIISGLLIEIGFVKYFTKVSWKRAIIVATVMNAVSATVGTFLIAILGLLIDVAWLFDFYTKLGMPLFHWTHFLLAYIFAVLVNILIEGDIIKIMTKLPLSKTFYWLFVANAITVGMCMPAFAFDSHSWLSITQAIAIPILVISVYAAYLVYRNRKSIFK